MNEQAGKKQEDRPWFIDDPGFSKAFREFEEALAARELRRKSVLRRAVNGCAVFGLNLVRLVSDEPFYDIGLALVKRDLDFSDTSRVFHFDRGLVIYADDRFGDKDTYAVISISLANEGTTVHVAQFNKYGALNAPIQEGFWTRFSIGGSQKCEYRDLSSSITIALRDLFTKHKHHAQDFSSPEGVRAVFKILSVNSESAVERVAPHTWEVRTGSKASRTISFRRESNAVILTRPALLEERTYVHVFGDQGNNTLSLSQALVLRAAVCAWEANPPQVQPAPPAKARAERALEP